MSFVDVMSQTHSCRVATDHMPGSNPGIETSRAVRAKYFVCFMCLGSGTGWVFPNTLAQQIPYFQTVMPAGVCIGTYMNYYTNLGVAALVLYVSLPLLTGRTRSIDVKYAAPLLLSFGALSPFLTAMTYNVLVNDSPVMLYATCCLGGVVGTLSAVIMTAFFTAYEDDYISAARSGNSVGNLLAAAVAAIQAPGSDHMLFSTTVYMIIFGTVLSFSIVAYFVITTYGLGLRRPPVAPTAEVPPASPSVSNVLLEERQVRAALPSLSHNVEDSSGSLACDSDETTEQSGYNIAGVTRHVSSSGASYSLLLPPQSPNPLVHTPVSITRSALMTILTIVPADHWLWVTLPYMLAVGFVDFNAWGVLSAIFPFAVDNISHSSRVSAATVGLAYQLGSLFLVLGDLSTTVLRVPIAWCLFCFSVATAVVYAAAAGLVRFGAANVRNELSRVDAGNVEWAGLMLALCFALSRFFESHVITSSYRAVASKFAAVANGNNNSSEEQETAPIAPKAAAAIGFMDQVCTFLGAMLATMVVYDVAQCT